VSSYIALLVSYFSETLNIYVTIELKATILNSSPIDLVIGRDSIRKYNHFSEIPSQLAAPITASPVTLGSVPTCCQATGSPCGCQPKRRSLLQDGSPKGRSASQQRDLAASQTRGMLGALVDRSDNLLSLNALLSNYSKTKKVGWTKETLDAFEAIKVAVAQCTTMHFLNDTDPVFLHTDASDYGIGGYLFQVVTGTEHPIAFVSKSLSLSQIRWAVIQKEAYAIFLCACI
jgi:RNase H-like domain found in reverse transcriptase